MRIAIGTDHAGYHLKELLKERLLQEGHTVLDQGTHSDEAVDYPVFIRPVAEMVAHGKAERGIVLGGSGQGECIAANKVPGVRAALCGDPYSARMSREHNDANVLSLGARVIGTELAWEIVQTWLSTQFTGEERHVRRIGKITAMEQARRFPIRELALLGQSLWYDYILRSELRSGAFRQLVRQGIAGVTSNPTIFEKGITGTDEYTEDIRRLAAQGQSREEILDALTLSDIQEAAKQLHPIHDLTQGADGFVSIELPPGLAHDTRGSIQAAEALWTRLGCENVMIKVPGTAEGVPAVEELTALGININITLLFSLEQYQAVAQAYLRGLERRVKAGQPVDQVASVASFFVSRIDTAVDALLEERSRSTTGDALRQRCQGLLGQAAIANAKLAYVQFTALFSGPQWSALAEQGAQVQRLLWASTSTKNSSYRDVLYVEELIAAHTVNTVPPVTLAAFLDHGVARPTLEEEVEDAQQTFDQLRELGIDMGAVTQRLQTDGIKAFADSYDHLLLAIEGQRSALVASARR